jgi:AAA+ ATPase superfamily predicted ATPase
MKFIGREQELKSLADLNAKENAIVVIYGRRRIGKSLLIRQFLKDSKALYFEGLEGQPTKRQLRNFVLQLNHQAGTHFAPVKNWSEAFLYLDEVLRKEPAWLVLDEFQWMANYRSQIVSELKMVWDQYLSRIPGVSLILCGSIASFMTSKVVKSKAMYGRTDKIIHLREFVLSESSQLLPAYGIRELLDAQMILGGVPKYLELVSDYPSLYTALDELAFKNNGYFLDEFDRIFVSHFGSNEDNIKIVTALARHPYGLYRKELVKEAGVDAGGGLTDHLVNLASAGFISAVCPIGKSTGSRIIKYHLSDSYLRFFFSFIKPNEAQIRTAPPLHFNTIAQQGHFHSWRGRAFENLCQQHAFRIANLLGFSGVQYKVGPYFRAPRGRTPGIQVDLIFDRSDNVLTLCEMKSSRSPINASVLNEIEQKRMLLQGLYPRHTIQPVLIYDGTITDEVARSPYIFRKLSADELI